MTIKPEKKAKSKLKWLDKHTLKGLLIYKKTLEKNQKESQAEIIRREIEKDDIFQTSDFGTVRYKTQNFQALNPEDNRNGQEHASKDDIKAWADHKHTSIEDLEKIIKVLAEKDFKTELS